MKLRYTRRASRQIEKAHAYIADRNPAAAAGVAASIHEVPDRLSDFPMLGHASVHAGTREIAAVGTPYVIVYRIDESAVTVLGVYHGAQHR